MPSGADDVQLTRTRPSPEDRAQSAGHPSQPGTVEHSGLAPLRSSMQAAVIARSPVTAQRDLVAGFGIAFEERGSHELKGVPGEWRAYLAQL